MAETTSHKRMHVKLWGAVLRHVNRAFSLWSAPPPRKRSAGDRDLERGEGAWAVQGPSGGRAPAAPAPVHDPPFAARRQSAGPSTRRWGAARDQPSRPKTPTPPPPPHTHVRSRCLTDAVAMDLVFNALPDVFTYQSLRHASYDAPWLNESAAPYRDRRQPQSAPAPQRRSTGGGSGSSGGGGGGGCTAGRGGKSDTCPLCLEKQRRPLASYIRSKSRQDRRADASIREEPEEELEPEGDAEAEAIPRPRAPSVEEHV